MTSNKGFTGHSGPSQSTPLRENSQLTFTEPTVVPDVQWTQNLSIHTYTQIQFL